MQQAGRIADKTAFMYLGKMIEQDNTDKLFTMPAHDLTRQYITGRFG
jgi:phosphate transport system ATP-binding protein